jgi:hypothetical protein
MVRKTSARNHGISVPGRLGNSSPAALAGNAMTWSGGVLRRAGSSASVRSSVTMTCASGNFTAQSAAGRAGPSCIASMPA